MAVVLLDSFDTGNTCALISPRQHILYSGGDAGESAELPTEVKEVLTLLVKSRWPIFNAKGARVTRGIN
jgi:hypothetical protein